MTTPETPADDYFQRTRVLARGMVRDGKHLFLCSRTADNTVSINRLLLRDETGALPWHGSKETVKGEIIAHASRAFWKTGAIVPAPAAIGEEEDWVALTELARHEVIEAIWQVLHDGRTTTLDVSEVGTSTSEPTPQMVLPLYTG